MVADHQFSYNGLTFGKETDNVRLDSAEGLGPPPSRVDILESPGTHGAFVFAEFLAERHVTLQGVITATAFEATVNAWRAAFKPQAAALPLVYKLPDDVQKRINCVPARRELQVDLLYSRKYARWAVELVAEDPRIYADTESSVSTNVATAGGVDFDIDFSFNFGGGTGGSVFVTNAGIFPTFPIIRFTGPATNPQTINVVTGESLKLNTTIAAGDFIEVNFLKRTIMLNNSASRYSALDTLSTWWNLSPGTTEIRFLATATDTNSLMTVTWRSAWI